MNLMKSKIPFFVAALFVAGLFSTSCERGTSLGAVGYPDPNDPLSFDTFNVPTADFFFYGKFDGKFRVWEDGRRSKWDTITRLDPNDVNFQTGRYGLLILRIFTEIFQELTLQTSFLA